MPKAVILPIGTWVRTPDNRVGQIVERDWMRNCEIQFGAGGPFEWHKNDTLCFATNKQIAEKTGTRVMKRDADRDNLQELSD